MTHPGCYLDEDAQGSRITKAVWYTENNSPICVSVTLALSLPCLILYYWGVEGVREKCCSVPSLKLASMGQHLDVLETRGITPS